MDALVWGGGRLGGSWGRVGRVGEAVAELPHVCYLLYDSWLYLLLSCSLAQTRLT